MNEEELHPGYIENDEIVQEPACGCRVGHWCAKHAAKAAHDAGHNWFDELDEDDE